VGGRTRVRTLLEIGILALAAWPACRFLGFGPIRRYYRGMATMVAALLVLYVAGIAVAARYAPGFVSLGAAAGLTAIVLERWRARAAWGRRRGLPPGTLSLFPRGPWVDRSFYAGQARRFGPIYKMSFLFKPMVCILGTGLGSELLREHADALVKPSVRLDKFIPRGFLRYMEADDHRHYRKLLTSPLSSEMLRENEQKLADEVRTLLQTMADESARAGATGIQPREPLRRLLSRAFALLLFGMRAGSEEYERLCALLDSLDLRAASFIPGRSDRRALAEAERIIRDRGREYRRAIEEGKSTPPSLLASLARTAPDAVDDETVLGNLVYMFLIGRVDVTGLLSWTLELLADNPDWADRLQRAVAAGDTAGADSLSSRIIKEALRLEQSEYINRKAVRDIRFREFLIPKGWLIRVLVREGHRDPELFSHPDRFDPDRYLGGNPEPRLFGLDGHSCIGIPLTDTISRAFLTQLTRGFEWSGVADGPRQFIPPHWQPGPDFRIRVQPRAAVASSDR
jgi:cytochrome P450